MIEIKIDVIRTKRYYLDGKLHRDDGPAIEYRDGTICWYQNGKLHRDDGPAVECYGGTKEWYQNGKLHRDDGPAIEYNDGDKWWYQNGRCHRDDGPAVEYTDRSKEWYQNGELHRDDGPAIVYSDGTKKWYIDDIEYTKEKYDSVMKRKNKIMHQIYERWYSGYLRKPETRMGYKYVSKAYYELMEEAEHQAKIEFFI